MSKVRFSLYLPEMEHKDLRIAAAIASMTMTDFVRAAIKEKIQRHTEQQSNPAKTGMIGDRPMYEWLETEISEIKTPKFHVIEGNRLDRELHRSPKKDLSLPPSYVAFVRKFGGAKLYRRSNYYEVGVLNSPQEKILKNGERLLRIGRFLDLKAYFICSELIPGREASIYEWTEDGFEKIADSFEEWLIIRCTDARESYDAKEWEEIVKGPKPFTSEEEAIVEARKHFQWQLVGFDENGNVKIAVRNNSSLVLPYLTIGMRTKNPTQDGQVWQSAMRLNISGIQPGQEHIIEHQIPQQIFTPDNTEFFQLAVPNPEDRDRYWEFKEKPLD